MPLHAQADLGQPYIDRQHAVVEQGIVPVFLDGFDDESWQRDEFRDAGGIKERRQRHDEQHIEDEQEVFGLEVADGQECAAPEHLPCADPVPAVGGVDGFGECELLEHRKDRQHDALHQQHDPREGIEEHMPRVVLRHIGGAVDPEQHALECAEAREEYQNAQEPVDQFKKDDAAEVFKDLLVGHEHRTEK